MIFGKNKENEKLQQQILIQEDNLKRLHIQLHNALTEKEAIQIELKDVKIHNMVLKNNLRAVNNAISKKHWTNKKLKQRLTDVQGDFDELFDAIEEQIEMAEQAPQPVVTKKKAPAKKKAAVKK